MFTVESVPLPFVYVGAAPRKGGRRPGYPFAEMLPGQSFLAPQDRAHAAVSAASLYKRKHPGWDYMRRAEAGGVRIYRVDGMATHPPRLP